MKGNLSLCLSPDREHLTLLVINEAWSHWPLCSDAAINESKWDPNNNLLCVLSWKSPAHTAEAGSWFHPNSYEGGAAASPDSWQFQIHVTVYSISTPPTQNKQYKYTGMQAPQTYSERLWNSFVLANLEKKRLYSYRALSTFTWVLVPYLHRGICGPTQNMANNGRELNVCSSVSAIHYSAAIHPSKSESSQISCLASTREGGLLLMEVEYVIGWCDWLKWRALIEQCSSPICASRLQILPLCLRGKVLHLHHLLCRARPSVPV